MIHEADTRTKLTSRGYEAASLARLLITRVLEIADDENIDMPTRNALADIGNGLGIVESRLDELRAYVETGKMEAST